MKRQAYIITDLGFGDAGKGTLVDALARRHEAGLVVRYNGGAQAAHTVVTDDGRSHVFHQLGAASFLPGVETFLSKYMLVNPTALLLENEELVAGGAPDALERMYVDERALVTCLYHIIANRLRECARGAKRHGSCGLGIGETVEDVLDCPERAVRVADLRDEKVLRDKLCWLRDRKRRQLEPWVSVLREQGDPYALKMIELLEDDGEFEDTLAVYQEAAASIRITGPEFLGKRLEKEPCVIFEGAQGVLLDEDKGFHPNTTWSCTTTRNARALLKEADFGGAVQTIGVLRAYHTRHGAGPFPTESAELTRLLIDQHNPTNNWQGSFRVGWFDLPLAKYAVQCAEGIDALAVTCLDRIEECPEWKVAVDYQELGDLPKPGDLEAQESLGCRLGRVRPNYRVMDRDPEVYSEWMAGELGVPLGIRSFGATAGDKEFLLG